MYVRDFVARVAVRQPLPLDSFTLFATGQDHFFLYMFPHAHTQIAVFSLCAVVS